MSPIFLSSLGNHIESKTALEECFKFGIIIETVYKLIGPLGRMVPEKEAGKNTMKPQDLEAEIMKLSLEDRASLAKKIILSLDGPSDAENLELWVAEAEKRLKELCEGNVEEMPAEEVFRRARVAIS